MKIALFLNNDIHCATALQALSRELENHQVKIILSRNVGKSDNLPAELLTLKKAEQFEIEKNFSYPCAFCDDINSAEFLADLKNFAPQLIISIRFGKIIKNPELLQLAEFGIINLHSGILPNYRGVMASFWAILNGEKHLGTTLHYISDGTIDTGEIIAFSNSKIDWNLPLISNINNLYQGGCELILEVIAKISAQEKIITKSQKDFGAGQYFSYPKEADVERFLKLMRLV